VLLAGALAYANSFSGAAVLDDGAAITWNPTIQSLAESLAPPPNTTVSGRPFANLTFAINYAISGVNLWSYHAVNLAIHLGAALALLGIVRRTLLTAPLAPRFGSAAPWMAWTVALLWVVHPLHTEAVTYVVQRVESLMGLLALLTLYSAIRAGDSRSRRWPVTSFVWCALGMATKEVMVVVPVLVWLWYRTFRAAAPPRRVVLALPLTWLILIPLVLDAPRGQTAGFGLAGWTPWSYLLTQTDVVTHYLRLVFWPSPLVFHYAWPAATSFRSVAPEAVCLATLAALTVVGLVRRHPLGFAGAWFFGLLAPSSSIVPVVTQIAAEHRMYIASAAVIALVVVGAVLAGRSLPRRQANLGVAAGLLCAVAAGLALAAQTFLRNRDYESAERLWEDTVRKQPGSPRAQLGYSLELVDRKWYQEAEPHARAAVSLEPLNPLAHRTLGFALAGQGRAAEAIVAIERALSLFPDDAVARRALVSIHASLASAYADAGQFERAVTAIDAALALNPAAQDAAELAGRRGRYQARQR
jgi:hypothetical protein